MRIFIPKIYRIQHRILDRAWNTIKDENGQFKWPNEDELIKRIKCKHSELLRAIYLLEEKEFVKHVVESKTVVCRPNGKLAFFQESILEDGWEKTKSNLLRWIQIFGIMTASFIGIVTFIWNINTTNKNLVDLRILKKDVESLQLKIQTIQNSELNPYFNRQNKFYSIKKTKTQTSK